MMKLNINTMGLVLVSALTLSMSSAFAASHSTDGMKKMDEMNADGMQKMEGKMDEMNADGMKKMQGKMDEMNADGMQKMDGKMDEMNADGTKKMHEKEKEMNKSSDD